MSKPKVTLEKLYKGWNPDTRMVERQYQMFVNNTPMDRGLEQNDNTSDVAVADKVLRTLAAAGAIDYEYHGESWFLHKD